MREALERDWGDPSRIHTAGIEARVALEQARETVGAFFGARPREVIFTSGATESIAAVAWGASVRGTNQVLTAVEHSAVRESAALHSEVRVVPVDGGGRVDMDALSGLLDDGTGVVHCQWANHEVGTVQPVAEVAEVIGERDRLLHVDAAQIAGRTTIDFRSLGADLVSISGHKLGGPPGIGVLLVRRGIRLQPLMVGGDQERARRAGTENVIAALGLAAAVTSIDVDTESKEQQVLADGLRAHLANIDGVTLYGDQEHRAPHLVCAGIADIEPQAVLLGLDRAGICAHSGSACASEGLEPSPVLEAMGLDAHHSLRLSVGWSSTSADVDAFGAAIGPVIAELRALRA